MSISVTLAPEVEQRLNRAASLHGSTPDAYIREIVEKALLATPTDIETLAERRERQARLNAPMVALLEKWRMEGEAVWEQMTPQEREQEEADLEALKNALDENRRLSGDYRSLLP